MSKASGSTQASVEPRAKGAASEGKKRKEMVRKTMAKVIGRSYMIRDPDEEEEEQDAPPTKT